MSSYYVGTGIDLDLVDNKELGKLHSTMYVTRIERMCTTIFTWEGGLHDEG